MHKFKSPCPQKESALGKSPSSLRDPKDINEESIFNLMFDSRIDPTTKLTIFFNQQVLNFKRSFFSSL